MISLTRLQAIITELNNVSSITIVRANQMFKKPAYPYATYNVLSVNEESWVSNIVELSYNENTQITTTRTNQLNEAIVSMNVFSDSYEGAINACQTIYESLKKRSLFDVALANDISIILNLTNIQDRTIFLEANYEYRFGFDLTLRANTYFDETSESIENVNATITSNTDSGNTNIITIGA